MIRFSDIHNRSYRKRHWIQIPCTSSGSVSNKYAAGLSDGYTYRAVCPFDAELERVWFSPTIAVTASGGIKITVVNEQKSATLLDGNCFSASDGNFGVDLLKGQPCYVDACATRYNITAGTQLTTTISATVGSAGFAALMQLRVKDNTDKRGNKVYKW